MGELIRACGRREWCQVLHSVRNPLRSGIRIKFMALRPTVQRQAPSQLTCESVFTIQNSTPSSSLMIIRLTALEPPPPTPMTCVHRTARR